MVKRGDERGLPQAVCCYDTDVVGRLLLTADDRGLTGCHFVRGRFLPEGLAEFGEDAADGAAHDSAFAEVEVWGLPAFTEVRAQELPAFAEACAWLDHYFAGEAPDPRELDLVPVGTPFQQAVRSAMLEIPYGRTATYGDLARRLEELTGRRQSAQAVGQAVGRNPFCIMVPCHRVMGAAGNLTGFGGGIQAKLALLELEGVDTAAFRWPAHGPWGR